MPTTWRRSGGLSVCLSPNFEPQNPENPWEGDENLRTYTLKKDRYQPEDSAQQKHPEAQKNPPSSAPQAQRIAWASSQKAATV